MRRFQSWSRTRSGRSTTRTGHRLLYFGLLLSSSLPGSTTRISLAKLKSGITLLQRQRIDEKDLIPPFCPYGVCCIGISRARDCHQSIHKFFLRPIDDYSS
jgi:hypothetical protein